MISELFSHLSPSELTDLQLMLQGYGHCENCWWGITKQTYCDSCREEARQTENVRRYGNTPHFQEWNPLKRMPDELLEHPYMSESVAYSHAKHE